MQPEVLAWTQAKLLTLMDEIMARGRFQKEHRFWVRTLAATATAALIAAQKASVSAIYAHHQGQANSIAVLVTYIKSNGAIAVTVPAAGINDSTAHACTGTASGTGTIS